MSTTDIQPSENNAQPPQTKKNTSIKKNRFKPILKVATFAFGILLLAVITLYFSRNQLIRHAVLTRLEKETGLSIAAEEINLSPFSSILQIQGLVITPPQGSETTFKLSTQHLLVAYSLQNAFTGRPPEIRKLSLTSVASEYQMSVSEKETIKVSTHSGDLSVSNISPGKQASIRFKSKGALDWPTSKVKMKDFTLDLNGTCSFDSSLRPTTLALHGQAKTLLHAQKQLPLTSNLSLSANISSLDSLDLEQFELDISSQKQQLATLSTTVNASIKQQLKGKLLSKLTIPAPSILSDLLLDFIQQPSSLKLIKSNPIQITLEATAASPTQYTITTHVIVPSLQASYKTEQDKTPRLLPPHSFTSSSRIALNIADNYMTIEDLQAQLNTEEQDLVSIVLTNGPLHLPVTETDKTQPMPLVELNIPAIPLDHLLPYTEAFGITPPKLNGLFSMKLTASPAQNKNGELLITAVSKLSDITGLTSDQPESSRLNLTQNALIHLASDKKITLGKFEIAVNDNRKALLNASASGFFDSSSKTYDLTTKLEKFDAALLHHILPPDEAGLVKSVALTGKCRLSSSKEEHTQLSSSLTLKDLVFGETVSLPDLKSTTRFTSDLALSPGTLNIKKLYLKSNTPDDTIADVTLTGTTALPWYRKKINAKLSSETLNATYLLQIIDKINQALESLEDEDKDDSKDPDKKDKHEIPEIEALLAPVHAVVELDLKNINYHKIDLTRCNGLVTLKGTDISAQELVLQMDDTNCTFSGHADLSMKKPASIDFKGGPLALAPLVSSFVDLDKQSTLKGDLTINQLSATFDPTIESKLLNKLTSRTDFSLNGVQLLNLPFLDELAEKHNMPSLQRLIFTDARANLKLRNGKTRFNQVFMKGDQIVLDLKGDYNLNNDKIELILEELAFGGDLLEDIEQTELSRVFKSGDRRGYKSLENPLTIKGNVNKPKTFLPSILSALMKQQRNASIERVLKNKLEFTLPGSSETNATKELTSNPVSTLLTPLLSSETDSPENKNSDQGKSTKESAKAKDIQKTQTKRKNNLNLLRNVVENLPTSSKTEKDPKSKNDKNNRDKNTESESKENKSETTDQNESTYKTESERPGLNMFFDLIKE